MAVTSTMSTLLDLLALIFVAAAVLMVPAIGLVFTVGRRPAARRMPVPARIVTYRLIVAAAGVGLASVCIGLLIGRDAADSVLAALVVAAAVLIWQPLGRQLAGRGVLAWALPVVAAAAFLGFGLIWTLTAELSSLGVLAGLLLWLLEAVVIGIGLANLWQLVDKRTRRAAPRGVDPLQPAKGDRPPIVSYVRHGSMLVVAGAVGAVVFLAPFTPKPTPGDLGDHADGSSSPPDAKVAARDSETADELSRVGLDASATPVQPTRPTDKPPPERPADSPRSIQPITPTHNAPGRPTDKPPPPGQTKVPPGHSDDHPKHQDEQDDQDDQER